MKQFQLTLFALFLSFASFALTPITGSLSVCVGSSTSLTDATPGGTWSSSNVAVATIGSTGIATGVSIGVCTITYTLSGAFVTASFTVNPNPTPIVGLTTVGVGSSIALSDATSGGSWSSSNPSVATVGAGSGIVTGVSPGTATIIYTLPDGCSVSVVITVVSSTSVASQSKGAGGISAYPNPTSGMLNIQWQNQQTGTAKIVVMDVIGREVYASTISIDAASGQVQIGLSELKDGIYLFTVKSDALSYNSKLIIRK